MKLPKGRKAILLLGLPLGLAAGGAFMFMQMSGTPAAPPEVPNPSPGFHGPMLALDQRVINLQSGGTYRYAKIGVTIELRPESEAFYALTGEGRATGEEEALAKVKVDVPVLLDILGSTVGKHTSDELTATDGRDQLKQELLAAVRAKLGEKEVIDLYFTDLVMQ
jgi:flagellar protein FliL